MLKWLEQADVKRLKEMRRLRREAKWDYVLSFADFEELDA